jgi:hypothetical protein
MKISGVSSRGEFKMNPGVELVGVPATVGVFVDRVEVTTRAGVSVDELNCSHAARENAARRHENVFRKTRRERPFFIKSF